MQNKTIDVTEVVDSARLSGLQLGVAILAIFIMLSDGFDLLSISTVAPVLLKEWSVDDSQMKWVISASMIGMAFGSVALGWLGDRIGRKGAYITCIAFLVVGSLASAYAVGVWSLFTYRFITGIGLGGVTPLAATLISEWTPKRIRGMAVACVVVAVPLGGMLGAQVAQLVLPVYGWRAIFFIGAALPLVFFVLSWFFLPESPRYLSQHVKKHPHLASLLNKMLGENRFDGSENFTVVETAPPPSGKWYSLLVVLLKPPFLGTTLLLCAAFFFNTLGLYAFANWLPRVLEYVGLNQHDALQGQKLFNFGGFFGAVGGATLIGIYGSRIVGSSLATIGGIATFFIALAMTAAMPINPSVQLFVAIWIAGMSLNGMQTFLYAVGANSYPTYIRAYGVGLAQTVSRIAGVASAAVVSVFLERKIPISSLYFLLTGVFAVVVASYFSMRTHLQGSKQNRELEAEAIRDGASP